MPRKFGSFFKIYKKIEIISCNNFSNKKSYRGIAEEEEQKLPQKDDGREEKIEQGEPRDMSRKLWCQLVPLGRSFVIFFKVPVVLEAGKRAPEQDELNVKYQ